MRGFLGGLGAVLIFAAWLLGAGIYLLTLYIAYLTGFFQMLLTLVFPMVAQIYWIFRIWYETGTFLNTLTLLCIAWVVIIGSAFALTAAVSEKA
jgi:predicted exporter